ncbi:unnamed protein product [Spirodela intermedia]|uniref:non-specific serine/threonine protein kinase n=1 Tax=Spirodela intermedia TaxID=51605 RepID=A0A7I8J6F2_SPIIN|nr:unnamed protein product [Spirodela intermedia]CAA6665681.1 unnamed protein product [Spirodela intermedia]
MRRLSPRRKVSNNDERPPPLCSPRHGIARSCSLRSQLCSSSRAWGLGWRPSLIEALKQIASKLKIPETLWNFSLNPCTQWIKINESFFNHHVYCQEITTTATNATTNTTWHVVSIEIKAADLAGVLPEEFGKLSYLSFLDLSRNYISGSIPAANWTSLPLKNINVLANRISGTIPEEIGNIKTLESLFLESNMMQGPLPRSLGSLSNLKRLLLSCNNFSGELPETLGNLKNLTDIRLDGTEISGKIPSFIGNWTQLQRLDMQGTSLEGPFPPEFSSFQAIMELRVSDLKNTGGSFPPLEKLISLKELVLRNCSISGSIPGYIGLFTQLQILDLSFNNLTGEIPKSFENLGRLTTMYLTSNKLTGSIPEWIKSTRKNMDISYNTFTDLSSAPPNCEQESRNYVASFSSTTSDSIASCLKKDLPCDGTPKNYNLFINCGGESVIVDGNEYERDTSLEGKSKYFLSSSRKWAYSSTGYFIWAPDAPFVEENASLFTMPNTELYKTARLNPLSLKYYGLCLQPGNYTVKLHFAEIVFTPPPTFGSLGRRVFDVSIQGKQVLRDFNIVAAANGTGKGVIRNFTALVEVGTLEIHFVWSGKGTNSIPDRSLYGPLISAISTNKLSIGATVGIVVASTVLVMLMIFGLVWFYLRRKAIENNELRGLELPTGSFSLRQIKAATRNFDPENKIGEGGFGPVYKGILPDGSMIAVKQLSSKSKQGNREFVTEIGMISALQHPNLVNFLGAALKEIRLRLNLDWQTRRKICIGIARGLAYLHEESRLKIVHRDIKTTNVLLDKDLNAKISDFGLAKLDEEENTHITDVYSFGVVALEIVSGKSNAKYLPKDDYIYLLDWACVLQEKGTLLDLVDPALGTNFSIEEAQQMLNLGLLCTNQSPTLRPAMSTVVSMLEGHTPVPVPTMKVNRTESMELRFRAIETPSRDGDSQAVSMGAHMANSSFSIQSSKEDLFRSTTSRLLDDFG